MDTKGVKSNIVNELITNNAGVNAKISSATGKLNISNQKDSNNNNNKIIISGIILILFVIIISVILFVLYNKKEEKYEKSKTIYEESYENINFKENKDLKKIYCKKDNIIDKNNTKAERIEIYYFNDEKLVTTIFHTNITSNGNDKTAIIDFYSDILEEDYNYKNVKTDLISNDENILVTVFIDNTSTAENLYKITNFDGYNNAKKTLTDSGFSCK